MNEDDEFLPFTARRAAHSREQYVAYRRAGFGERQALYLIATEGKNLETPDDDGDWDEHLEGPTSTGNPDS